jgi:chaperonin GroEL (HSP60 family)
MRKEHKSGKIHAGPNPFTGKIEDMRILNVIEPLRIGKQSINSATDAAVMILRIDDVIASKSSPMPEYGSGDDMPSFDD